MNERVQITIDPELRERAQRRANDLGISFAEYVRRVLAGDLGPPRPKPDISVIFDLVTDGPVTNIAKDKDKMLGEAAWEDYQRSTRRRSRHRSGGKKASR